MSAPRDFLRKMQRLLGAEYAAFAASLAEPGQVGLRVNTLKLSAEDFSRISPFTLTAVGAYEPAGFLVTDESRPGRHPYHAAGLYYLQEPAAMVVGATLAAMLRARRGADDGPPWVLDLAAAPGGKATHLAARLGDAGLLVANDVHQRARSNSGRKPGALGRAPGAHPQRRARTAGRPFWACVRRRAAGRPLLRRGALPPPGGV
jgi:16S rRNA C967 or C1407 C5-methylase (RsmB/RsmF family)